MEKNNDKIKSRSKRRAPVLIHVSASHQISFGTQAPHILWSLAVIRVGVDVARQTKLFYIVLTPQKHALHQSCSSEYYDSIFCIFFSSGPFNVLTVRQYRASLCNFLLDNFYRPIKRTAQENTTLFRSYALNQMFGHRLDDP